MRPYWYKCLRIHNPEAEGSSPSLATTNPLKLNDLHSVSTDFFLKLTVYGSVCGY